MYIARAFLVDFLTWNQELNKRHPSNEWSVAHDARSAALGISIPAHCTIHIANRKEPTTQYHIYICTHRCNQGSKLLLMLLLSSRGPNDKHIQTPI
jgi:hypothetical protein